MRQLNFDFAVQSYVLHLGTTSLGDLADYVYIRWVLALFKMVTATCLDFCRYGVVVSLIILKKKRFMRAYEKKSVPLHSDCLLTETLNMERGH